MENYGNNGLVPNIGQTGNITKNIEEKSMFGDYGKNSVKDIFEESPVSNIFFSQGNVENIQKLIRYRVNKETSKVIDRQSNNNLIVIMRSIFLQYGDASLTTKEALIKEIRNLNDRVANFSVDRIISQLGQHDTYLKDISSMPRPLDHPKYDNKRNYTYDTSNIISNN
tara:strand:- start:688 stop:1191 length:504 start_codon:yes stop_codon:yes gene_type:complete